eukprot:7207750-Alexandrium_andersonii.AAC.1
MRAQGRANATVVRQQRGQRELMRVTCQLWMAHLARTGRATHGLQAAGWRASALPRGTCCNTA